jgi:methylated-DNA-[protein]-cysteine S-methyltransferase
MNHAQWKMQSTVGPLYLVASEKGIRGILWRKPSAPILTELDGSAIGLLLKHTVKQLGEYFAGQRQEFDLPLDIEGSDFQKSVWQQLQKIPYGQTVSYRDIARRIQNEKAVRAVGSANGRNPISIVVPCHRVIASDGTLGGYAGGLPVKTKLLEIERKSRSSIPLI